jgi:hypothetical protein
MKLDWIAHGSAAVLAESLCLSGGIAAKFLDSAGKPEAFRKGRGQAAFAYSTVSEKTQKTL